MGQRIGQRKHAGRTVVLLALAAAVLAACGGTGTGDTTAGTAGGGDPITITHRYGETTLDGRPARIVSLDTQWTDVLAALGAPPAAYALDPTLKARFPWQEGKLSGEAFEVASTLPFEKLIELDPDLIVVTWAARNEDDYRKLAEIAPTIPLLTDNQVDSWQDIATAAGEVLGEPEKATALIEQAQQDTEALKAQYPGLAGRTYAMANYVAGDGIHVIADPKDGSSVFFDQLGLQIAPTILAQGKDVSGRVKLSLENVSMLDADLLVLFTSGADPRELAGYDALPAVQRGSVVVLDYPAVLGLNTPTPLAIPYSVERLRPALEAAAGA